MEGLSLRQVRKRYRRGVEALKGVSLEAPGGLLGLVGPNGAGKTTMMRIMATITRPSSGRVHLDGIDVVAHPGAVRGRLGYLPQAFDFYPALRVDEVLAYVAELKGIPGRDRRGRVDEVIGQTGLTSFRRRRVGTLSGGMKRRLGIAQALLNRPRLLILDEPTAGLDPAERARFRSLLSSLAGDRLVVLSTHVVFDIEAAATNLILLSGGRIAFSGTPAEALGLVRGRVWRVAGDEGLAAELSRRPGVTLVGTQRGEGALWVRVVADSAPCAGAERVQPTLEDAYLLLMGEAG